jgi:hypothetical protein
VPIYNKRLILISDQINGHYAWSTAVADEN